MMLKLVFLIVVAAHLGSPLFKRELSEAEIQEITDVFSTYDVDDNGFITASEIGATIADTQEGGEAPSDSRLREMVAQLDTDGDMAINLEEFLAAMARGQALYDP